MPRPARGVWNCCGLRMTTSVAKANLYFRSCRDHQADYAMGQIEWARCGRSAAPVADSSHRTTPPHSPVFKQSAKAVVSEQGADGMRRLPRTPDRSMRQAPNEKLSRLSD